MSDNKPLLDRVDYMAALPQTESDVPDIVLKAALFVRAAREVAKENAQLREQLAAVTAERDATEANDPLTLEELRGMHGKPVYLVDCERPQNTGWLIWEADLPEWSEDAKSYGMAWICYRRPPEGGRA